MGSSREGKGDGALLYVITSFHLKQTRDVLEDNVKIALQNARTAGIAATHVLLEGDKDELFARIDVKLAEQVAQLLSEGKLVISGINKRPNYFDIFSYANTLGDGHVAIANSDILFPVETVERIRSSGLKPAEACFTLTRWNVTLNGIFIQGLTPSPPWPETRPNDLKRHEQNFFSYDAYVFRAPIAIPPDTAGVFVGSFGCDTTLCGLLKLSGYAVSNATLALRTAHFDVKPRSYRSPSSISDLDRNVDAMVSALRRPEAGLPNNVKALFDAQGPLAKGKLWFGHADVGKFGRALQRGIGAAAWSDTASPTPLTIHKVKVSRAEVESGAFDISALVAACEKERLFVEWEVSGFEPGQHIIDVLMNSPRRNATYPISQYQWQALRAPEHMTPDDERLYQDVMALFQRTLIAPRQTQAEITRLSASEADALDKRMSELLKNDLEDQAAAASSAPPPSILMIDPDALNWQGHYLSYDLQLRKAAMEKGVSSSFLMNAKMDLAFVPAGMKVYPFLDSYSWDIGNRGIESPRTDAFVDQLTTAIGEEKKANPDRPLIVYMYCGSFEHARLIQEVMAKFDGVGAVIHLFWLSIDSYKSDEYLNNWAHFASSVAKDPRIRLTVATEGLQTLLRKKTGAYFDVAPHPSTTFADNTDVSRWPARKLAAGETPTVLFPGAVREEKGFLSSVEAIRSLSTKGEPKFPCIVSGRTRADTPAPLVNALDGIRNNLVTIEDRVLGDDQFVDFLASGDIIVLPYKAAAFADRPSGILIDAITLGRPLVAIEGTWLGDAVSLYGWGEIVADDGGPAIAAAIRKMRPRYHLYLDAIRTSRDGYIHQHSWGRLLKSIVTGVHPGPKRPVTTIRTVSYERPAAVSVDETAVVARLLNARKGRRHLMLDVGAHIGASASNFHRLDWTVHCFEPDPANREKLTKEFGEKSNVIIDARAVSDKPATSVAFFKSDESAGISALRASRETHREANRVDVTTVADYAKEWGIARADFLKIAAEGFELSVLKGVPWDQFKPDVIQCGYDDAKTIAFGHTWQETANFLRELGYAVYISEWHPIIRHGIAHDWRRVVPYPGRQVAMDSWGSILAFRTDPGYAAVKEAFDACLHRRNFPVTTPSVVAPVVAAPPSQPALTQPDDLQRFKNLHVGKRCFVMGNGPSLNKMDLSKLDGEFVFGCNSVFLLFDRVKWRPSYYTCVDSRVLPDRSQEIAAMLRDNPSMRAFLPTEMQDHISKSLTPTRSIFPPLSNISYFRETWNSKDYLPFSMFSVDINEHVIQPYTVAITMLQIAMYMGFSEIYLIGCDTSYTIPPDVQKEGITEKGEIGLGLTSTQDNDPNHFDPRYFGKGRKWHDPQVDKMIEHYRYAKQVSELKGKTKIYNATVGGNLEVFERTEFNSLFAPRPIPRASHTTGVVQNGRDSYIRAVQVSAQPGSASAGASLGGEGVASMHPGSVTQQRPLTIFSVGTKSSNGESAEQMPVAAPIETQPVAPVIQATVCAPEPTKPTVGGDSKVKTPPSQVSSGGARDIARWIKSHVLRKRAAQVVIAVVVGLLIGGGFLLSMPEQGDLRPMLIAITSLVLLGVGGLYFAYRTLGLAQRLSAENATLQQRLQETSGLVAALQRETRGDSQRQAATVGAIATRIERSVTTSLQTVEQRISQLDGALRSELAQLKGEQAKTQAGTVQELGSTNTRLLEAIARAEKLNGELLQLREMHRTVASAVDQVRQQQGNTGQNLDEAVERLVQVTSRTDDLGVQWRTLARAQSGVAADIASLNLKTTDISQGLDEIGGQHARLAEDFVATSEHLQWLAGKTDTLVADVGELKEAQASTRSGIGALNAQAANVSDAIDNIQQQQALLAQDAAGIDARVDSEAHHLSQIAERVAFVDDIAKSTGATVELLAGDFGRHAVEIRAGLDGLEKRARHTELRLDTTSHHLTTQEMTLTNLVKGVASAELSGAAEVAALQAGIDAVEAKASDELATMGRQVADVAALSQVLAGEVSTLLNELGQRIGGVDDRLKSSEGAVSGLTVALASAKADGAEEVTALEKRIAASEAVAVDHVEKVGLKVEALGQRVSLGEAAGARELAALDKRIAASEAVAVDHVEKVGLKVEALGQRVSLGEAAGARELVALAKAIAAVESRADDNVAEVGRKIADVASLSQETNLEVARRLSDLAQTVASSEAAGAAEVASLHKQIAEVAEQAIVSGKATLDLNDGIDAIRLRLSGVDERLAEKADVSAFSELVNRHQSLERAVASSEAAGAAEVASLHKMIADVAGLAATSEKATGDLSTRLEDIGMRLSNAGERIASSEAILAEFTQLKHELSDLTELSSQISTEYARIDSRISASAVSVSLMDGRLLTAENTLAGKVNQTDFEEFNALGRQVAIEAASWAQRAAMLESREKALSAALADAETAGAEEVAALRTNIKAMTAALAGAETAGAQEVGKLERSISALSARSVDELGTIKSRLAEVDGKFASESEIRQQQIAKAGAELVAAIAVQAEAGEVIAQAVSRLGESVDRVRTEATTAMVDNTTIYQPFNRKLQLAHIETLENEWVRKLSLSVPRMAFGYMAARAAEVERELDGRLAASIEDVLLRTLVARATKGASVRVLEIGTLFGTGAAIMFDALKNHYRNVHFTLLDPLDRYHADGHADMVTGQPVTEAVVRRNLAKAGMQDDQVRLITRLSTDPEAISEASEGLYDVLVIDADHSYGGVKSDFENYARLVRLGGHVIFDNYGSEDWPDVKAYVDAEMPDADFLTPVGSSWQTAVYRVVRAAEGAVRRRPAAAKPAGRVPKRASTRKKS